MKIAFIGDIALFGKLSLVNNAQLKEYFEDVSNLLSEEDFVVGNLETPFSRKKKTHGAKSAYICSDVENIEVLKWLNISAVSLANNHMFDYGKEGYETTKQLLQEAGIEFFGTEGKNLKVNKDNNRLAFNGFCCYSSGPLQCVPYGQYGVNEYNLGLAQKVLLDNVNNGYFNIFCVHAGIEHVNYPSCDTIAAARLLADKASYLYIGHHPHVAQGIEKHKESLIAYSLGNFCFDDVYSSVSDKPLIELSENNRSSFILEVEIDNNRVVSHKIIPIYIGKDKMIVGKGVTDVDIQKYTEVFHSMNEVQYCNYRNRLINEYLSGRTSQRNIMWYVKRLRPRYFKIFMNAKIRSIKYNKSVKNYIK